MIYKRHEMMNAMLRNNYRAQTESRDADTRKETADALVPSSEANAVSDAPSTPMVPESKKRRVQHSMDRKQKTSGNAESEWRPTFSPRPKVRFSHLGGMDMLLRDLRELIEPPFLHPELFQHYGVEPIRGILLHGPPGCGKTILALAVAGELNLPFLHISAPELVSGVSGESESKIRRLFEAAQANAPSLIFIDEIDVIATRRESAQREMERRMVAQLISCMDALRDSPSSVVVLAATHRPDSMDAALRRAGRFDREISLAIPDEQARKSILSVLTKGMRMDLTVDIAELSKSTAGYVGADMQALTREAGIIAITRTLRHLKGTDVVMQMEEMEVHPSCPFTADQLASFHITNNDFALALKKIQPSAKREGFATIPNVTWQDIGALAAVRDELLLSIVEPLRHPERFSSLGITSPSGILLWGPPGCGKTLLAKAVANESRANFIAVKGPELFNKFVGESEAAVRKVFERARASSPCIIFFDEIDALCPRRNGDSETQTSERVVNQLLTEMDGLESRKQVFVIAATNRPDMIDDAMKRPGRLDKLLYVGLPTSEDRRDILQTLTRCVPMDESVKLDVIAMDKRCDGLTGADLSQLVREAGLAYWRLGNRDALEPKLSAMHFDMALSRIVPSVSADVLKRMGKLMEQQQLHQKRCGNTVS